MKDTGQMTIQKTHTDTSYPYVRARTSHFPEHYQNQHHRDRPGAHGLLYPLPGQVPDHGTADHLA